MGPQYSCYNGDYVCMGAEKNHVPIPLETRLMFNSLGGQVGCQELCSNYSNKQQMGQQSYSNEEAVRRKESCSNSIFSNQRIAQQCEWLESHIYDRWENGEWERHRSINVLEGKMGWLSKVGVGKQLIYMNLKPHFKTYC